MRSSSTRRATYKYCSDPVPPMVPPTASYVHVSNSPIPVLKNVRSVLTLPTYYNGCTTITYSLTSTSNWLITVCQSRFSATIADFRPSACEKESLDKLQDIFLCMIHKLYCSKESNKFFPGIQSFVNCMCNNVPIVVSNVVYVEIVSEKAD